MKFLIAISISTLFFIMSGCGLATTPYTERSQFMLVSESEEVALGEQSRDEILKKSKLSEDKKLTEMVEQVGEAIAKVSGRDDFQWEFYLIEDKQVNAFCLPGGKVFVYSGLMKLVKSESELATVISHEVAHAIARHGAERMSMSKASTLGKSVISQALGLGSSEWAGTFDMAYGVGVNYGLILPYSREQEYEADRIGLILMEKAGFKLEDALSFWKSMNSLTDGSSGFDFASTHPSSQKRIAKIQELIPTIKSKY